MSEERVFTLRYYVLNTSFHGFRYIGDRRNHWSERFFWAICCALSWMATGLLIRSALDDFYNNAVTFVVETSYLDWNTSFPSVSVCQIDNQEKIAQLTDRLYGDPHDYNLDEIIKELVFYHGLSFYTLQLCGPEAPILNEHCLKKRNFTAFASEVRGSCQDVIKACSWNNQSFDCCQYFGAMDTEMGLCYAIGSVQVNDPEIPKFQMVSNKYNGPGSLKLDIYGYANVYIQGEQEVPSLTSPNTDVIQVTPRIYYRRLMTITEIENQPEVKDVSVTQRKCRFAYESDLEVYPHYSYSACCVQCKKDAQLRTCGCAHHLMPHTDVNERCTIEGLYCLSTRDADLAVLKAPWANRTGLVCNCLPSCTEIELTVVKDDKLAITDDIAIVELTLERLPSERFKRTVVRGNLDLVGICVAAAIIMESLILCGPQSVGQIPKMSAANLMLDAFNRHNPTKPALIDLKTGQSYTYKDLINCSLNLASNLRALIEKDDVIAVIADNSHKFFVTVLAGLCLAAPVHLINPGSTVYELIKLLSLSKPKVVFCCAKSLQNIQEVQLQLPLKVVVVLDDYNSSCSIAFEFPAKKQNHLLFYDDLIQTPQQSEFRVDEDIDVDNQVGIIFNSSGTTGLPKAVMLTHGNYHIALMDCIQPDIYKTHPDQTVLLVIPFYHVYGFSIFTAALYLGETVLIMDRFDPVMYLETVQNYKVENLFLVPSLANFLAKSPLVDGYNLDCVQALYSAAAPLSEELTRILLARLKVGRVRQMYGLTESAAAICMTRLDDDAGKDASCGRLMPGRQLKVVDVVTNQPLGSNQRGELCVRGNIMKGYIEHSQKTTEIIDADGFLHTGDVGYYDDDGFIFVVDRLKDLIKYKAFQVAPAQLEDIILGHPAVKEAAVVGKPDDRAGEIPVAFVVKRPGCDVADADIVNLVAEHVSQEKRLRGGVRFVDDLPKNQIGKVLKIKLKELL